MKKRPALVVLSGPLAPRTIEVSRPIRLGRSSSNDIHVPDESLSRNHCLFEPVGESDIRLTDLASANGTLVNGEPLGDESVLLKEGDVVEVGSSRLQVGEEKASLPASVDLGLEKKDAPAEPAPAAAKPGSSLRFVLWGGALLVCAASLGFLVAVSGKVSPPPTEKALSQDVEPTLVSFAYEKVKADLSGIFRYALALSPDGVLSVKIDDTQNNRHVPVRPKRLTEEARAELQKMLAFSTLQAFERDVRGASPDDGASLESLVLKTVYSSEACEVRVVNADEPPAFRELRERLEAFSKSELGVWAISYSREKLVALAEESVKLGEVKWEERDVHVGNLWASLVAFREALFYLETVNPKPACAATAKAGLDRAKNELDVRWTEQRFLADKALNMAQWGRACEELRRLLDMIPDRQEARHREARQKLLSAESHLRKEAK